MEPIQPNFNDQINNNFSNGIMDLNQNHYVELQGGKKSIYNLKRPVFYPLLFIFSIIVCFIFWFGVLLYMSKLPSDSNSGAYLVNAMIMMSYLQIVNKIYLILGILIVAVNIAISSKYEKYIKDRTYKMGYLRIVHFVILIIFLMTLPFIIVSAQNKIEKMKKDAGQYSSKLWITISDETNKDKIYNSCIDHINKNINAWVVYNIFPIFRSNDKLSSKTYCNWQTEGIVYNNAIKNKVSFACTQLSDEKIKDDCIIGSAKDLKDCDLMKSNYNKPRCFDKVVTKIEDCNLITDNVTGSNSINCIFRLAKTIEDCDFIKDYNNKNLCIQRVANNPTDCNSIDDERQKNYCIITSTNKIEDCNLINPNLKDFCIERLSKKIEDCTLISSSNERESCIMNLATNSKNKEWCKLLSLEKYKNDCVSLIDWLSITRVEDCKSYDGVGTKEDCVFKLATKIEDCISLKDYTEARDFCILKISQKYNTKEWCNLVKSENFKREWCSK